MRRLPVILVATLSIAALAPLAQGNGEQYEWVELKGTAPAWLDDGVRAKAREAAAKGMVYSPTTGEFLGPEAMAPANIPYGSPDYLFIRPGALFNSDSGALCTYNFIYSASSQIGVAGHCVAGVGETVYILSTPAPTLPLLSALGTVASFQNGGVGNDWALITINAGWRQWVDPNMAYIGGPSCPAWTGTGGAVKITGHGIQTGLVASVPRVNTASASNGNSFTGLGQVSGGDSGSPIVQVVGSTSCSGGLAAGVLTHCLGIAGLVCLPSYSATDIRRVPATVTVGFDPA